MDGDNDEREFYATKGKLSDSDNTKIQIQAPIHPMSCYKRRMCHW